MNSKCSSLASVLLFIALLAACSGGPQTLRLPDGAEYRGQLRDGLFHDQGEITWSNGDHYRGEFAAGRLHGRGVLTLANGDRLSGVFVEGVLQGFGEYRHADGRVYRGEFKNGEYHGLGEEVDADGQRRQGLFLDGLQSGLGVYQGKNDEAYIGEFADGQFHGFGHYSSTEGRYTGEFSHGYFHGEGTFLYADGREESGRWQWGRFTGSEADRRRQLNTAMDAERAFQRQPEQLQRQARALPAGDPDTVEFYLLTAALDGEQKVFGREIATVKAVMDQRFDTAPRTLSLSNHPETFAELPMASLSGMEKALSLLAEKMNPQQDILFVYLTSHGSEDHQLSVQAPGMDLHDFPAPYLGELIHALPVKWKVIVISSCFSGGFIPHLEAPGHLVITAARHDRTSFGCSDDADMTYFGRAFFSEALPGAESFQGAFGHARELVADWEDEDDYTHSEPQISVGEEVEVYLREWFAGGRGKAINEERLTENQ